MVKKLRRVFHLKGLHLFCTMGCLLTFWLIPNTCSSEATDTESEGNRLTVGIPSPVVSLDPTDYRDRNTQIVLKNMFDSLTTREKNMRVVPQLAESWRPVDDTTWEFKLRRGVKFQNGDDLTAEDVKFTLERVVRLGAVDGHTSPRKSLLGPLKAVKIIDDYSVQMKTEKPWPVLPLMLTLQEIVPMKYMKASGSKGFQKNPIGTGPFRFVRFEGKERLILERFENYYGGSPENPPVQKAPLKHLVFKTVPEKIKRIALLKKGECDLISQLTPEAIGILRMDSGIKVSSHPATRSYFAEINLTRPPFIDRRTRLALNYAVDMQAVVDHILGGHGQVLPTILLPNAFAYDVSLKPYPYNPKLARKMLDDADFSRGLLLRISCLENDRQFANIIALFLEKVGVRSAIHVISRDDQKNLRRTSTWDIFVSSWGNSTLDPVGILVPKFKSNGRGNYSNYTNKEVDALLSRAESTMESQRREYYYKRVQEIIHRDTPMIFGYAAEEFYGVRRRVKNFVPFADGMLNMHDVYLEKGD